MSITHHLSFTRVAVATLLATTLTAGISGCSSSDSATPVTTIDGSVFASSVNGASCGIYTGPDAMVGSLFTTDESGTFSVTIPKSKLAGDLVLYCEGGTYTDEVTGTTETAGIMAAFATAGTLSDGAGLNATPGSTIVFQLISDYDMTPAEAEAAFELAFGYVPDVTAMPTDATNPASGSSLAAIEAGLRAAAFAQLTWDNELSANQQFDFLTALAEDLSDGVQNGMSVGGGNVTIGVAGPTLSTVDFAGAMDSFRTRTALTSSYKISYNSMMMDQHGKDQFRINITDLGGVPVTGLTVSAMPMMYMETKTHSTPVEGCSEIDSGNYDCTVYYVMASKMGDGSSMGEWDLKVMVGGMMGEAVHFYPKVMMAMGDTPVVMLRNSNLTMTMNDVTSARTFQIFKSELTRIAASNHTFELFTSTMETMMSFPAVDNSATLNAGTMNELPISGMTVEVSITPTFDVVYDASEDGNGYWSATGIAGLADDAAVSLYVRVTINGHILNSSPDGVAGDGINNYGTFNVTTPSGIVILM
ncbi:MAG: hypothetical protein OEM07_02720 [Gammaproteobacteria bacterium]|nr:hypothetical protein [Gammaproteobacteria bacterium]